MCMSLYIIRGEPEHASVVPLSLHDALPIFGRSRGPPTGYDGHLPVDASAPGCCFDQMPERASGERTVSSFCIRAPFASHRDRKSTRLNSSHVEISYAVFCLKKKRNPYVTIT